METSSLPVDEDAFLWDEEVSQGPSARIRLTAAEQLAIKLCFDVTLQSAFALEDPNECLAKRFGHLELVEQPPMAPIGRSVGSDELTNHLYEINVEGGDLGFEVNPPNIPALSRIVLIGGRPKILISKVLLAFERTSLFQTHELPPMRMLDPVNQETDGNRFFRLCFAPEQEKAHDVACLMAWIRLEDGADMLEITAWPAEKA